MNKQIIEKVIELAIKHEQTCMCEQHMNARRINQDEIDAVNLLMLTEEGYSFIMGIVCNLCARDKEAYAAFKLYVDGTVDLNSKMKYTNN